VDTGLRAKIEFLSQPGAYAHAPAAVERIETHFAWVFIAGDLVYKLKKPFRFRGFDLTTLAARRANCELELALNRRLAPSVYLGVVPLCAQGTELVLHGPGAPVEWLVEMRRLPHELALDAIAAAGELPDARLRALVERLAAFYATAVRAPWDGAGYRAALVRDSAHYARELASPALRLDTMRVAALEARLTDYVAANAQLLDARVAAGRIVDSHGDLRPEHVFMTPEPQIIDCLEFSAELRLQDSAAEIAFLALECERLRLGTLPERLLALYCDACHDDVPPDLFAFYRARHALARALVAAWHLDEPLPAAAAAGWRARARWYLDAGLRGG